MTMFSLSGFFILGGHFCITAVGGLFYPSACRANGYAAASVIGRLGGIIGPYVGGVMLSAHLPLGQIFLVYGIVPLILAAVVFLLGIQHHRLMADQSR